MALVGLGALWHLANPETQPKPWIQLDHLIDGWMDGERERERDADVPLVQVDRWALVLQCPQETPCKIRKRNTFLLYVIISPVMSHMRLNLIKSWHLCVTELLIEAKYLQARLPWYNHAFQKNRPVSHGLCDLWFFWCTTWTLFNSIQFNSSQISFIGMNV